MAAVMALEAGKSAPTYYCIHDNLGRFLPFNILNINYCYGLIHAFDIYGIFFYCCSPDNIHILCFYSR